MLKNRLLILLFAITTMSFTMHKYYVSMCEIQYLPERQTMQIILGVFIDDMELTLNKNHNTILNLATEKEVENVDAIYMEYLQRHFIISVNGTKLNYTLIGKEYENDIVRFYLEIDGIKSMNSLEVTNTTLFRDFQDQRNIIKIQVKKFHKTFYLDRKNDKGLLKF